NSAAPAGAGQFPLFYRAPVALRADLHADLKLLDRADFGFAANTNSVPIMVSEFAQGSRYYPIVFVGDPVMPVAGLGLEQKNVFVDEAGHWDAKRSYIPAYVRRYPFTFISDPASDNFILGIDTACERVISGESGPEGAVALFEGGQPTAFTQDALKFCAALQ